MLPIKLYMPYKSYYTKQGPFFQVYGLFINRNVTIAPDKEKWAALRQPV